MGLFLHTTKFQFYLSDVSSNMSTLLCIRKPHFLRYRQLEAGGVTMYDKR